jgi:hypothetical protein
MLNPGCPVAAAAAAVLLWLVQVCNHMMRKDLKDMRSFTLYVIDALVSGYPCGWGRSGGAG